MNQTLHKFILAVLAAAITVGLSLAAPAQVTPKPAPTAKPGKPAGPVVQPGTPVPVPEYRHRYTTGGTYERSIAVAPNLNLTLCVTEGNLKVNGWNRNEVRVYVEDGTKFSFKVKETAADGKPVWVQPVNMSPRPGGNAECIWGNAIEVDVPLNTTLSLTGKEIHAQVDTVKKVTVKTVGGDINIRDVKQGVSAYTGEGDITVEEALGQVSLETTTGNIVVVDSEPSDIGDTFRAKTNGGAVSLTRVLHRQQDVSSISGSVYFMGAVKSGGNYSFTTNNGSIRLALPYATNCKLVATFTAGSFPMPELPFKVETENIAPNDLKTIVAKIGNGGDALIKVSTAQGIIGIRKQ